MDDEPDLALERRSAEIERYEVVYARNKEVGENGDAGSGARGGQLQFSGAGDKPDRSTAGDAGEPNLLRRGGEALVIGDERLGLGGRSGDKFGICVEAKADGAEPDDVEIAAARSRQTHGDVGLASVEQGLTLLAAHFDDQPRRTLNQTRERRGQSRGR